MSNLVYYLAVASFFATCSLGVAIVCTPDATDYCKCQSDDFTLDLRQFLSLPLRNVPDHENPGVYVYTFTPCSPFDCGSYGDPSGFVCQHNADGVYSWYIARNYDRPTWNIISVKPLEFTVTYTGGDNTYEPDYLERETETYNPYSKPSVRGAIVTFKYDGSISDTTMALDSESTTDYNLFYLFNVKGKALTLGGSSGGGGTAAGVVGLVLMSIFLAAVLTYFIVGIIVNYRYRDAKGFDAVPNAAFWKDLPFLIKDGFLFTISPCYKRENYQKF